MKPSQLTRRASVPKRSTEGHILMRDSWNTQMVREFVPEPGESVASKHPFSKFSGTLSMQRASNGPACISPVERLEYSYIELFLLQSREGGLDYYLRLCFAGLARSPRFFRLRSRPPAEATHRLFLVGSPEPHLQRADALRRRRAACPSGDRTKPPSC